jgi:membrane associated rhomboid family serine protease
MFPISDSIKADRFPFFNLFIIIVTVYVFIQEVLAPDSTGFINHYALIPANVHLSEYITLVPFVTSIFLHGGILHIISNMWFLWVFGNNVETSLPPPVFLLLYISAGIAGNIFQYMLMPDSTVPMIGASGAVAGILGCYFIFFPYSKVKTLFFIFFFITIIEISAPIMLGYWFLLQLFSGLVSLPGADSQGGIAFFAHVAGFVIGILYAIILKVKPQTGYATG